MKRIIGSVSDWKAYLGGLGAGLWEGHEGAPAVFPCLVVSLVAEQGRRGQRCWHHRFFTLADAEQLRSASPAGGVP